MPGDIVIIFKDGTWLERWEYDGAEGWEYKGTPVVNKERKFTRKNKIYNYLMWCDLLEFENSKEYDKDKTPKQAFDEVMNNAMKIVNKHDDNKE